MSERKFADETIAKGQHMDLDLMDAALQAEIDAGAVNPTGVILGTPSAKMNSNLSGEKQTMEMTPKVFGPPQYGSPDPASAAGRLMTLEDGHPFEGLAGVSEVAISDDYAGGLSLDAGESDEIDATDGAKELAAEHNLDLSTVEGTGKDGRITKDDVQGALDAADNDDDADDDDGDDDAS